MRKDFFHIVSNLSFYFEKGQKVLVVSLNVYLTKQTITDFQNC